MKQHKLFWQSSYDRGLDILLSMWPGIKEKYPDATLDIAYGWDLFLKVASNNAERMAWYHDVCKLMDQPGIIHHGRIGQEQLKELRKECGILAYPTYFPEIFMIGAVEAQRDGLVPVSVSKAALPETMKHGVLVEGDIADKETQKKFFTALLDLMGNEEAWTEKSRMCKGFAQNFTWDKQATKWTSHFESALPQDTLVTIYTPTVREGFWNIMAHNIASQTYQNIEWIIVDDHKIDRSAIAKKYAKKYEINIRYFRGKPRKTTRTYSLINANNTAIQHAKGSLFVFLQDFVLMPLTGIEQLVIEHKRHPTDFIAPVDSYYQPKIQPDTTNSEDWFNGELDVVGQYMRTNIRKANKGFRESRVLTDFEQNYGAVATQTLKELGGYWEFYDEALGWDDTEIIYRAWKKGHKLFIDELNECMCIDHWGTLGKDEGGTSVNRTRRLNDPRFVWMKDQMDKGLLPVVRTQEIDDAIDLQYIIPEDIKDEDCVEWMRNHTDEIVKGWV